ncbi:hypothetical protein PpBr36_05081 [Pyricularia pennisetigena]|uniref:hypothetical protein n=1 Tax=Pyricularia pennisetigena TaxID=1578925 RepID=UPI00114F5131|nr:hypothetical protein PpBr36_05081 [Pyricularia pennisetigena]TLS26360.1 hypothetical protein PpBr36_05081 [Pyricularia pennisetigena]
MAFIRPYQPTDFEATAFICRATLPPSLAKSPAGVKLSPYLWTHQYTELSPSHCFVLDDGTGRCVGYVIGTPDVFAFAAAYHGYVAKHLSTADMTPRQMETREAWTTPEGEVNEQALLQLAREPRWLLLEGVEGKEEMVQRYRGTMHIDMLEPWQGKGWGRKLIEQFMESVKRRQGERVPVVLEDGSGQEMMLDSGKGVHIGISGENTKVVKFYEKVGFRVQEGGEREGGVWMVYDL